ncbi:MAG TPA: phosphatase PAP2 family protein [Oligoflexus sp.]|uniref:phosphatase PAP2 family protein n=1 Tax=Oligoflexus sp. TaxID=1971216 RepID=UPI002D7F29EC|nr:phosphatase PAP2 family protein [Oligoflexus sp.]HET9236638.1 phosphatase PAP2 family protein [Oligoflexus sp.]
MRRAHYLLLLFIQAGAGHAETEPPPETVSHYFTSLWDQHLEPTFEDGFDRTGYTILAVGAACTLVSNNQDHWVRREWRGEQKVSRDVTRFGAVWGSGGPSLLIAGTLLYYDPQPGLAFSEAVALTSLTHYSLSRLSSRPRPGNPLIRTSFPSGHTANAWVMATSLTYSYGWKVGAPTYAAALITMAARIADDRHWLSDTVAAAALGAFWGRATAFHHGQDKLRIQPILSSASLGMELAYEF